LQAASFAQGLYQVAYQGLQGYNVQGLSPAACKIVFKLTWVVAAWKFSSYPLRLLQGSGLVWLQGWGFGVQLQVLVGSLQVLTPSCRFWSAVAGFDIQLQVLVQFAGFDTQLQVLTSSCSCRFWHPAGSDIKLQVLVLQLQV
jgi:hypothetical protein